MKPSHTRVQMKTIPDVSEHKTVPRAGLHMIDMKESEAPKTYLIPYLDGHSAPDHTHEDHQQCHNATAQKSTPPRIRQLVLHISNNKGPVDEFVPELTFAKRLYKHFL